MIFVQHRVNKLKSLKKINKDIGFELDVRSNNKKLTICHDALANGEDLKKILKKTSHRLVIFDVKEEGLEIPLLKLVNKFKIKNYFFLNVTPPRIDYLIKKKVKINLSLRLSSFENINRINDFFKKIKWIWIDTFNNEIPISYERLFKLRKKFNLCLVSPELVPTNNINIFNFFKKNKKKIKLFNAICTKKIHLWRKI